MTQRGDLPSAKSLDLQICEGCNAIHIDLYDRDGRPFATAALPPENWAPFLAHFKQLAASVGRDTETLSRSIASEIADRIRPTICETWSSRGGSSIEGRISAEDFNTLMRLLGVRPH